MQDALQGMIAYSRVSQVGFLLLGKGTHWGLGLAGAEMMYVTHALGKGLLFMAAGVIIVQVGTRSISKLGGLNIGLGFDGFDPRSGFGFGLLFCRRRGRRGRRGRRCQECAVNFDFGQVPCVKKRNDNHGCGNSHIEQKSDRKCKSLSEFPVFASNERIFNQARNLSL